MMCPGQPVWAAGPCAVRDLWSALTVIAYDIICVSSKKYRTSRLQSVTFTYRLHWIITNIVSMVNDPLHVIYYTWPYFVILIPPTRRRYLDLSTLISTTVIYHKYPGSMRFLMKMMAVKNRQGTYNTWCRFNRIYLVL